MSRLYDSLINKSKEIILRILNDDVKTVEWFKGNKPAVIIIGDKYGQVEIIDQLSVVMKAENATIPILAEGFISYIKNKLPSMPNNFNCFKDIKSSFVTTEFRSFQRKDIIGSLFKKLSRTINKTFLFNQRYALYESSTFNKIFINYRWQCKCSLDYDCVKEKIQRQSDGKRSWIYHTLEPSTDYHMVIANIFESSFHFEESQYNRWLEGGRFCRWPEYYIQKYKDILLPGKAKGKDRFWDDIEMERSNCPIIFCPPGSHRVYDKIPDGYSWICTLCPKDYVKPNAGNHGCVPCVGKLSVDNGERTACVDPYTNIVVDYSTREFYIIGSISLFALDLVIVTLFTFIINRDTPIVTTSDFKVSIFHMSLHALTLTFAPFAFFTNRTCVTKPLVFTTLYTFNIGIVFIKSQKLLQAFLSKVRLTAEEVKRTILTQIFTIVIFIFTVNLVLFVSYHQQPAQILEFENPTKLTREQVCNTYFHSTMVMIAIAVIQLMCAVQAFRGRNLPNVMNDGIILMYATFILTASFVVCFVIVPFQKQTEKEISQCVALLVNTVVIMFLLYGQKAYRILFCPEQNTRAYFRCQRLKGMKQNVNERIEMK